MGRLFVILGALAAVAGVSGMLLIGSNEPASAIQRQRPPSSAAPSVRTALLQEDRVTVVVESVGSVIANESIEVTSQTSSVLTRIAFEEGAHVERGAVIVELDGAQEQAALAEAEAALANSRSIHDRSRELLKTGALSDAHMQQLAADLKRDEARLHSASARLAETIVRAPFSGQLGLRRVSPGSLVNPGTVITTLDDVATVKVDFSVPEAALPALRPGLPVVASTSVYPGQTFNGRIASVDPRIDSETRSVRVRAQFDNRDRRLAPGMFVTTTLTRAERIALVAPERALIPEQAKQYVFIVENAVAMRREVQVGHRSPGRVEITSGVAAGERLVIDGAIKLRDGMRVVEGEPLETEPDAQGVIS